MEKSYLKLLEQSFPGITAAINRCSTLGFRWEASEIFTAEKNGQVIAHAALLECPILIEGRWHSIGALHAICTDANHQGQGLASELIQKALLWSQNLYATVLLFTEIPSFYEKLSFSKIQEYRFYLPIRKPKGSQALRPVIAPQDNDLFIRCFRDREDLSNKFWLKDNGIIASFNTLFSTYPSFWPLYYSSAIDGMISFIIKDKTLHLFDVVASKLPTLDAILDHLPTEINDLYFYFPPDRFTENAIPEPYLYDNGHLIMHNKLDINCPFIISPLSRC